MTYCHCSRCYFGLANDTSALNARGTQRSHTVIAAVVISDWLVTGQRSMWDQRDILSLPFLAFVGVLSVARTVSLLIF